MSGHFVSPAGRRRHPHEHLGPVRRGWGIWLFVYGVTLREQHEAFSGTSATPRCSSAKRRASRSGRNRPPGPVDSGHLVPMTAYLDQITSIVAAIEKVLG